MSGNKANHLISTSYLCNLHNQSNGGIVLRVAHFSECVVDGNARIGQRHDTFVREKAEAAKTDKILQRVYQTILQKAEKVTNRRKYNEY